MFEPDPVAALDPSPDGWCRRYTPGHRVHWIQVTRALRTPPIRYTLVGAAGGDVTVRHEPTGTEERWWLHDASRLVAASVLAGTTEVALHEHGLLVIRDRDGRSARFHPCRRPEDWRGCSEGKAGGIPGIGLG